MMLMRTTAGNLLTEDDNGPYNLTLLPVQVPALRGATGWVSSTAACHGQ